VADSPHLERLEVASHQVDVGLLVAAVVALVPREERREVLAVDEAADGLQVGLGPVVIGQGGHVDVVQRGQGEEVQDVRLEVVGGQQNIADDAAVRGNLVGHAEGGIEGVGRRRPVDHRAYAADALRQADGVERVAADQNVLEAAPQGAAGAGVLDLAAIDHHVDPHVAFDARDRIDGNRGALA
jgi:hypothetical protein